MNQTTPELPLAVEVKIVTPPKLYPFFILAFYAAGGWWKIHKELFAAPDNDEINSAIASLQKRGWSHISVCRLP